MANGRVLVELLDHVGPFRGGQTYFVAVLAGGVRTEAAYWVHADHPAVMALDDHAVAPDEATYNSILRAAEEAYPASVLLAPPTA
jgi:hypothetical protein